MPMRKKMSSSQQKLPRLWGAPAGSKPAARSAPRRHLATAAARNILVGVAVVTGMLCAFNAFSATYWVATNGNDANPGTSNAPFATPQKAVTLTALAAGDTIYVRGGVYNLTSQVKPSKHGTEGNYFKLWAYPGEQPIFDFASMTPTSDKALDMRRNYWHVRGIEVRNAPNNGIFVGGIGNIIEGCIIYDCKNDGLVLGSTSVRATNSLILNCDSFRNYQPGDGNNGDGFAAKDGCGPGNVFRGCRAWNNADDGWDFYNNNHSVVLENCWAFANGYNLWGYSGTWKGNGNGFKLGGAGTTGRHYLTNCLAFENRSKGFDHNHSTAGQTIVHCTGFSNNVNFSFYETPAIGQNLLINNASFTGTATNLEPTTIQVSNSWQLVTVTAADFASTDGALARLPRNADYTLPVTAFLRTSAGSQLRDRGANVGMAFHGAAPDLGAYEWSPPAVAVLSDPQWTPGGFQFRVSGLSGAGPVVVHGSADLTHWSPVLTNPPVSGSLDVVDSTAPDLPSRFYRVSEN